MIRISVDFFKTHFSDASLLLRLPNSDLYLRFSMFSAEYGLFNRGGAFSHFECSRSAIVPADGNIRDILTPLRRWRKNKNRARRANELLNVSATII